MGADRGSRAGVRRRGLAFVATYLKESVAFDVRHGTRTFLRTPKESLERDGQEALDGGLYVASFTSVVRAGLTDCRERCGADRFDRMQFVDLGCGKGKAVLVYALEFSTETSPIAVGIENDRNLARRAEHNVRRCGVEPQVRIATDNAVNVGEYLTAPELVVYFYNSFEGPTLDATLDALADRPHHMIYVDPLQAATLRERGYQVERRVDGRYAATRWLVASLG